MTDNPHSTPDRHAAEAASSHRLATDGRFPDLRVAAELARVELVRGIRWTATQDFWLLYGAVSAVGMLLGCAFALDLGYDAGTALAAGESTWFTTGGAATVWSATWLFLTGLLVVDAAGSNGDVANDGHYLTIRPVADVAAGKVVAAASKFVGFLLAPALACYLGVALGVGTAWPLLGATVAAVVAVASAATVGYPLGFLVKGAIRRSDLLAKAKPVVAAGLGVGYLVVMTTGEFVALVERLTPLLRAPPLGWLAELAFVTTTGASAQPVAAAGALAAGAFAVVAGTLLSVPAADYAWRADRVAPARESDQPTTAPDHWVDRVLAAVTRQPATRGVASTTLLRVYRSPLQLVFVAFPLVGAIPVGEQLLAAGSVPWYAPWLAVWYGAWAAGASVPLNPLGTQGAALATLLTAPADARHVVHGHVVAAALPTAPLTAGVAVALGAAAGHEPPALAVLAVASVVVVGCACVLGVGLGSVFPRFDAVDFSGSRQAVPPSKVAYGAFSTVLTATVVAAAVVADDLAAALVAALLTQWLPFDATVDAAALVPVAWIALGAVAVSVPVSYRVAVERLRHYRLS